MNRIRKLTAILFCAAMVVPVVAHASANQVIADCNDDGSLSKQYSKQDLKNALDSLPADVKDYSDCQDVISAALGAAGPKKKGGGGGGGAHAAAKPKVSKAQKRKSNARKDAAALGAARGKHPKIRIGNTKIEPGKNGLFNLSDASNGLPVPLLLALIALGLVAAGGAFLTLRKRIPALARIPLPSLSLGPLRRVSFPRFRR